MQLKPFFYDFTETLKDIVDFFQSEITDFEFKVTHSSNFIEHAMLTFIVNNKFNGELFYSNEKKLLTVKIIYNLYKFEKTIKFVGAESIQAQGILSLTKEIHRFLKKLGNKPTSKSIVNYFKIKFPDALFKNDILSFTYKDIKVEIVFKREVVRVWVKPSLEIIKLDSLDSEEELYQKIIDIIDMSLKEKDEFLFEAKTNYNIIDISDSDEEDYEINLQNGQTIEASDLFYDLSQIFANAEVRIMSIEHPFEAAITEDGKVIGGSVISKEMPNEDDYDSGIQSIVRFSIAVDDSHRNLGIATKLITNIISRYKKHGTKIQAQVINPLMENLLIKLGFEKISESGSSEGLVYQL